MDIDAGLDSGIMLRPVADQEQVALFVYKTMSDPFAGRISFFKVVSGVVRNDMTVENYSRKGQERLSHLSVMQGRKAVEVTELHAGDLGAVALALEAEFVIAGPSGRRTVPASEFFVDLFTTALGEDEILAEIRFPRYTGWKHHYEKFNRTAQAWSMVAVAVALKVEGGSIAEARVGLTNMGSTPIRATAVEQALVGQQATEDTARAAAEHATEGTSAPSDADAASDYREHLARVLTGRAVLTAAG